MRAYFFNNMYLSSIQQGIQTAHVVHEMFTRYPVMYWDSQTDILYDWANNHKVIIVLNAGYSENIRKVAETLEQPNCPYPWASFNESEEALGGALTSVGVILPPKIYETARVLREMNVSLVHKNDRYFAPQDLNPNLLGFVADVPFTKLESDLINYLSMYKLAN